LTAREPSAVEVILQAEREHEASPCASSNGEAGWLCACSRPGASRWFGFEAYRQHRANAALAALKAAGFVVATRDEIRTREGDAWDGALNEMHDLGWMHDGALADGFARNPYRELIDADVTRDHEEDER
jgi:hypothetical protein